MAIKSLKDRLKDEVVKAGSLIPQPRRAPPPKEEPPPPDIRDLIDDSRVCNELVRLVHQSNNWGRSILDAERARAPITDRIKEILSKYEIGSASAGSLRVAYYSTSRSVLSEKLLLEHGVQPDVIEECKVKTESVGLRISEV